MTLCEVFKMFVYLIVIACILKCLFYLTTRLRKNSASVDVRIMHRRMQKNNPPAFGETVKDSFISREMDKDGGGSISTIMILSHQ